MSITKEVKAAVMVLLAITLLIFGYNFLKGNNLLTNNRTFYALYDNVEGLSTSSLVTINGLQVGKILKIDFADDSGKLKVTFNVNSDFKFGKNSIAKIYSAGFISGKSLGIVPEVNAVALAESGQVLKSKVDDGMMDMVVSSLDPIQHKLNAVLQKTDVMLTSLNLLMNEENSKNISASLKDLSSSLKSLKYTSGSLQSLLAENEVNLSQTMTNFKDASVNAKTLTAKLSNAPIDKTMATLNETVNTFSSISKKLNSSQGTAGKMLNDENVYNNLEKATRQLDLLLQDMKLHPKRYVHFSVFGKKDKGYNQPKDSLK